MRRGAAVVGRRRGRLAMAAAAVGGGGRGCCGSLPPHCRRGMLITRAISQFRLQAHDLGSKPVVISGCDRCAFATAAGRQWRARRRRRRAVVGFFHRCGRRLHSARPRGAVVCVGRARVAFVHCEGAIAFSHCSLIILLRCVARFHAVCLRWRVAARPQRVRQGSLAAVGAPRNPGALGTIDLPMSSQSVP